MALSIRSDLVGSQNLKIDHDNNGVLEEFNRNDTFADLLVAINAAASGKHAD